MHPHPTPTNDLATCSAAELETVIARDFPASAWMHPIRKLLGVVLPALVWLRDQRGVPLSPARISDAVLLDGLQQLVNELDAAGSEAQSLCTAVRVQISTIPGFSPAAAVQSDSVYEHQGFQWMQVKRAIEHLNTAPVVN